VQTFTIGDLEVVFTGYALTGDEVVAFTKC